MDKYEIRDGRIHIADQVERLPEDVPRDMVRAVEAFHIYGINPIVYRSEKKESWMLLFRENEAEKLSEIIKIVNGDVSGKDLANYEDKTILIGCFPSMAGLILAVSSGGNIYGADQPLYHETLESLSKTLETSERLSRLLKK